MIDLNAGGGMPRVSLVRSLKGWLTLVLASGFVACADSEPRGYETTSMAGAAFGGNDSAGAAGQHGEVTNAADWCAARRVLESKCQVCHTDPPRHGAPFPLVTYEDTQVTSAAGKPRYRGIEAMVAGDSMPPSYIELDPPVPPLSPDEKAIVLGWCEAGAPLVSDEECGDR